MQHVAWLMVFVHGLSVYVVMDNRWEKSDLHHGYSSGEKVEAELCMISGHVHH